MFEFFKALGVCFKSGFSPPPPPTHTHIHTPHQECYAVVTGGIEVSQAVLKERYDFIMYTGSTPVGKIVMKAAAVNVTPVLLEMGGKRYVRT